MGGIRGARTPPNATAPGSASGEHAPPTGNEHGGGFPSALTCAAQHRLQALEHVRRRGFGDIADDAVMNALLALATKARDPSARPPAKIKEWLLRRSVLEGYALRRRAAAVAGTNPHLGVPLALAAGVTCGEVAHTGLVDEDAGDPERNLRAELDARTSAQWRSCVSAALDGLLPQDLAALREEVERAGTGAVATVAHRKRLERARTRARQALASYGITDARVPAELPLPAARHAPAR